MIKNIALIFLWGCVCCLSLPWAKGQSPVRQVDGAGSAYLRGWLVGSSNSEAVSLEGKGRKDEEPRKLAGAATGEKVINPAYAEISPGSCQFQLKSGDKILQSVIFDLSPQAAYTVIAWRVGGKWELKVYPDGPFPKNVVDRPLRLLNFADERETLLSLDNGPETKVAAGTVQEFNMASKSVSFTVKVLALDGGAPAQSSGELDFAAAPSAYVVISSDYRGRMRPRVINGGVLPVSEN